MEDTEIYEIINDTNDALRSAINNLEDKVNDIKAHSDDMIKELQYGLHDFEERINSLDIAIAEVNTKISELSYVVEQLSDKVKYS